jgi:hypothetical protein
MFLEVDVRHRLIGGVASALMAIVASGVSSGGAVAKTQHVNMVVRWNQTMLATFAAASVPAPASSRLAAIVAAATFDAVDGIQRKYTPIHVPAGAPKGASPQAAAAASTYTALVLLFPAQKPSLDAALAESLASLDDEDSSATSIAAGVAWGNQVGSQIVAWRAADGFAATPPAYVFDTTPGQWQPTPGGSGPPRFRTLATTEPFALTSPSQFRPAGPPALTSARYALDLNEVKAYGGQISSVRTAYQTETAVFWQVDTPPSLWDRVADSLAMAHHFNLIQTARLLGYLNIAMADASFAVWDAKTFYNSWRPVTAIQHADADGNDATAADPSWMPLLVTPYFQEYPSAHSGISSAAAHVLASYFGGHADFTMTSAGLPGVERSFSSFDAALEQVADARIYAGFHFRFSCDDGIVLGQEVGAWVQSALMRPAEEDGD